MEPKCGADDSKRETFIAEYNTECSQRSYATGLMASERNKIRKMQGRSQLCYQCFANTTSAYTKGRSRSLRA
jgi:hypothetical protein